MSVLPADQRELFLPLADGLHESPCWATFLRNLAVRAGANAAILAVCLRPGGAPAVTRYGAPSAGPEPRLDPARLIELGLKPLSMLRPGRIYALDELLDYDDPAALERQRRALDGRGWRFGRALRIAAENGAEACLLLTRDREDISASTTAALTAAAPHLRAGLKTLTILAEQQLRLEMAQSALARIGVGQIAFDPAGQVILADPQAEAVLPLLAERRLPVLPDVAQAIAEACARLAGAAAGESALLPIDPRRELYLLLRKAEHTPDRTGPSPAVIGTLRQPRREDPRAAIRLLVRRYGLSEREAALAHAISLGETIIEAGRRLRLTDETARNYSKRIYAKTQTRGQADLVRLLLEGPMPFA